VTVIGQIKQARDDWGGVNDLSREGKHLWSLAWAGGTGAPFSPGLGRSARNLETSNDGHRLGGTGRGGIEAFPCGL